MCVLRYHKTQTQANILTNLVCSKMVFEQKCCVSDPVDATHGYSEKCLDHVSEVLPGLIGGSADLATLNKAYLDNHGDFQ